MKFYRLSIFVIILLAHSVVHTSMQTSRPTLFKKNNSLAFLDDFFLGDVVKRTLVYSGWQVCMRFSTGLFSTLSEVVHYMRVVSGRAFNRLCRRPDALSIEEIVMWGNSVEKITNALCEQSVSGAIMLRNMRIDDNQEDEAIDENWKVYLDEVDRIFVHIVNRLEAVIPHYQLALGQREWLVKATQVLSESSSASIVFLINEISCTLRQIIAVCKAAHSAQELEHDQLKKWATTAQLLFDNVQLLVRGTAKTESLSSARTADFGNFAPGMDCFPH